MHALRRWTILLWIGSGMCVLAGTGWLLAGGQRGAEIANVLALPVGLVGVVLTVVAGTRTSRQKVVTGDEAPVRPSANSQDRRGSRGPRGPAGRPAVVFLLVTILVVAVVATIAVIDDVGTVGRREGPPIAVGVHPFTARTTTNAVWTASTEDRSIYRIDPETGRSERIVAPAPPELITPTERSVWMLDDSGHVYRYDISTRQFSLVPTGPDAVTDFVVTATYVWLAHSDENSLSRFNPGTGAVDIESVVLGDAPGALTYGAGRLYIGAQTRDVVTVVDEETGSIVDEHTVPPISQGVFYDNGILYVADARTPPGGGTVVTLTPIDPVSWIPGRPVRLENVSAITATADDTVWAAYPLENVIRQVDLVTGATLGDPVAGVGRDAVDMAVLDDRLWIANKQEGTVIRVGIG